MVETFLEIQLNNNKWDVRCAAHKEANMNDIKFETHEWCQFRQVLVIVFFRLTLTHT